MASRKASGPGRRPNRSEGTARSKHTGSRGAERAASGAPSPHPDASGRPDGSQRDPAAEDWADEAARARTSSDPRRVAPHDAAGVPSTGDTR